MIILSQACYPQAEVAVGQWKEYLPYGSAIKVVASNNLIFCATPYSIFSFDPASSEISRYSKINGLAETGISTILSIRIPKTW